MSALLPVMAVEKTLPHGARMSPEMLLTPSPLHLSKQLKEERKRVRVENITVAFNIENM